jgi:hypothetical protein
MYDLKMKCHRLISLFIKNNYLKKKGKKKKAIKIIETYISSIISYNKKNKKIENIRKVQMWVKLYLKAIKIKRKQ